jgi:ribonuclease P protein subunit RPR2
MARRHLGKRDAKGIAVDRIEGLFALAQSEAKVGRHDRAKRYVSLALRIGERHKVRPGHKREYCPNCHAYFVPPVNVRSRTGAGKVVITCLGCGHILRFPLASRGGE